MTRLQSSKTTRLIVLAVLLLASIVYLSVTWPTEKPTPLPTDFGDAFNHDNDAISEKPVNNYVKKPKARPGTKTGLAVANKGFNAGEYYEQDINDDETRNPSRFLGDITEVDPSELEDAMAEEDLEYKENEKPPKYQKLAGAPGPNGFNIPKVLPAVEVKLYAVVPQTFENVKPFDFRIYSHNVKNGGHTKLVPGEQPWAKRSRKVSSSIRNNAIHNTVVALQEVYKFQLDDIMNDLNKFSSDWEYYGAGRIDGKEEGEFVPILYKKSEWELVFSDTLWLNEKNPRIAYEGWDAKYLRVVSFVTLKHKESGNYINLFNTHFDHLGEISQIGSAHMIIEPMNNINNWPSFLAGDLNCEPNSKAYKLVSENYKDLSKLVTPFTKYGHSGSTVTGFQGEVLGRGGQTIDYIFVPKYAIKASQAPSCESDKSIHSAASSKIFLQLLGFGLMHSKFNGHYMSDHRPIIADYRLGPNNC